MTAKRERGLPLLPGHEATADDLRDWLTRALGPPPDHRVEEFQRAGRQKTDGCELTLSLPDGDRVRYRFGEQRELSTPASLRIDVPRIAEHQEHLLTRPRATVDGEHRAAPAVRTPTTVRRAIENLSGILQVATEHGVIPGNPARSVRKVPAERKPPVTPLAPVELEAIIARFS